MKVQGNKMKRTIKILSLTLVFIMAFGVVSAFAKGKTLSNNKFYAEIPENFQVSDAYADDHYYIEDMVEYTGNLEIIVEGNILFPDGIKNTEIDVIKDRFTKHYQVEESTEFEIKKAEKGKINGITACYICGLSNDGLSEEFIHVYILTTKENVYIVKAVGNVDTAENEPEFLKAFMTSFLINGTYFDGEKLTKEYDFSEEEHYIDALERDVLTEYYYSYNSGTVGGAVLIILTLFCFPVVTIIFIILFVKTKKKLKEYKEFFGSIEQARIAMRQHYMQNSSYQPMQNNGGYYTNVPGVPNPYNQGVQPAPQNQTQYQPQYQPTQPAQTNLPPEMQEFQ